MDFVEKEKSQPHYAPVDFTVIVAVILLFFGLVWFYVVHQPPVDCEPIPYQMVDYRLELLRCHPFLNLIIYVLLFPILILIGCYIVIITKNKLTVLICVLFAIVLGSFGFCESFHRGSAILEHISSIEFNGHVYHLTRYTYEDIITRPQTGLIFLYQCEMNGIVCKGRNLEMTYIKNNSHLIIKDNKTTLQIRSGVQIFELNIGEAFAG